MAAQPMMIAFTSGMAFGSEGISVPAADCWAANSLLRCSMLSRLFILILRCDIALCFAEAFCHIARSIGIPANFRLRVAAKEKSDSALRMTGRFQGRGTWRAKGPDITHGWLSEEAAIFAIELAGALVTNLKGCACGV
jgi:hypothetical protein